MVYPLSTNKSRTVNSFTAKPDKEPIIDVNDPSGWEGLSKWNSASELPGHNQFYKILMLHPCNK